MDEVRDIKKKYENLIKKIKYLNELIWRKKILEIIEFPKKIHPNTLK